MEKLDLRAQLKDLYQPPAKKAALVDVPAMQFAMIDGEVEPGATIADSPAFQEAIQALYSVSYTLKFTAKLRPDNPVDYPIMALEALWWAATPDEHVQRPDRWTMMIMQPDLITAEMFAAAVQKAQAKRPVPALAKVRLQRFHEGLAVQIMHIGPYSAEGPTIERMLAYARAQGYNPRGRHHEIYVGDPRQAHPERLKTVLRQPVEKAT